MPCCVVYDSGILRLYLWEKRRPYVGDTIILQRLRFRPDRGNAGDCRNDGTRRGGFGVWQRR